jgi:hypothetical protein
MMSSLVIRSKRTKLLQIATALWFLLLALSASDVSIGANVAAGGFSLVLLFGAWIEFVASRRTVEIDTGSREIHVREKSLLLGHRDTTYRFRQFRSVVSYLTYGRFSTNRVELVTDDQKALLIGTFDPVSDAKSFCDIPGITESPSATELRNLVSSLCELNNGGFLGRQVTTAKL